MTAKEAREAIRVNYGYEGAAHKIYEYIQTKIKQAVLDKCVNCECRFPITAYYITMDGQTHSTPNYPKIEKAMSLLRNDGFYCRVSQSGENWKVEIEW